LYLFKDQGSPNSSVYHVYSDWQEDTITWNNQPCGTNFDNSTACSLISEDTVFTDGNQENTWQCWNVTNMTRFEYEQAARRVSIALHTFEGGYADKFYSKEYTNSSLWPYLNITYHLADAIAPNLTIISPQNQSYNNATILVNISAQDANLASVWWYNGTDNLTYIGAVYYTFSQGSNTITAYANDTIGNLNFTSRTFYVDSIKPIINISNPRNITYTNNSILINISAFDINLDKMWFYNGSNNITYTSFIYQTLAEGSHEFIFYANDSFGNVNNTQITFSVDITPPEVFITYPLNTSYRENISGLNYIVDNTAQFCWYSLNKGQVNVSITCGTNLSGLVNNEGSNTWIIWTNDTNNNINFSSITFYKDTISPAINIIEPESKTYGYNVSLPLNFSVYDLSGVSSCWWNLDNVQNISLPNCQNITFNVSEGSHTLTLYANDSLGNQAWASRNFTVNTQLAIALDNPENNAWLNFREIEFNYTVNTAGVIEKCELWIDSAGWHANQTNSSAINKTGGINKFRLNLSDGTFKWNVFCAGTYSAFALNNFTLNIDTTLPSIAINYPLNNTIFRQNVSLALNFTVSDSNLERCWYSLNNGIINRTTNCVNGINNLTFGNVNGIYNLTLYANDSAKNVVFIKVENITIEYDNLAPTLDLSEPKGTKTSKNGIPLQFSVSDNVDSLAEINCGYNVTYASTGGYVSGLEKVNLANCQNTVFSVPSDSEYSIYLSAQDRTGNLNIVGSNFSVSTSSTSQPPSSGGGGGGIFNKSFGGRVELNIFDISDVVMRRGESKKLSVGVKNIGNIFLNKCKIEGKWIFSEDIKGIAEGEKAEFIFDLKVPENAEVKDYGIDLIVVCEEGQASKSFLLSLAGKNVEIRVNNTEVKKDLLNIYYLIKDLSGQKQNLNLEYSLIDKNGKELVKKTENFEFPENKEELRNFNLELPSTIESGEYVLFISATSEFGVASVQESVIIGKGSLTGFASLGDANTTASILILILFGIIIAAFIIRRFVRKKEHVAREVHNEKAKSHIRIKMNKDKKGEILPENDFFEFLDKELKGINLKGKWLRINFRKD
jgi:hypothetical protein